MSERTEEDFFRDYYGQLVGATVLAVELMPDEDGDSWGAGAFWPKLTVRLAENDLTRALGVVGETVELEISRDEEGNGPGFLFGLAKPEPIRRAE
jgi:hypothetical protein